MFKRIKTFWSAFWNAIKTAYNRAFKDKPEENTQQFTDTKRFNFLAIFVSKLNNLSNIESTYDVESDSTQAEVLKDLCKTIEAKRFDIVEKMLGEGDVWAFPAHDEKGRLFNRFVDSECARVLNMDGDEITDIIGIIDSYVDKHNNVFYLNRRHTLNGDNLTIETYVTNDRNEKKYLEEWAELESVYELQGAAHIGVGRFKSPASSRGLSPIYGVPLNFGCEEIEATIFNDMAMIETEFKRAESKIFADPLVMKKGKGNNGEDVWTMPEGMFPIDTRGGQSGANIDIFSPAIRYSEYYAKLLGDMQRYEQQVGTDRGFLTPFESGTSATATEIRRANASTISLIDKIHTATKNGVQSTIKADAVFLNIADDLYSFKFDFFDAFEDTDKQYERLASAVDRGVAEKEDELQWLFPNLTPEERAEKIARIEANKQNNTDTAIENMLMGQ